LPYHQVLAMKNIKLDVVGLSFSQAQSDAYAVLLGEVGGSRILPIVIGYPEAQAIAATLRNFSPSRPLTHDLFTDFAAGFHISVKEVLVYNLVNGIFFAKIVCSKANETVVIDARTSDAVALAMRFGADIFTYDFIMDAAGIIIEENDFAFLEAMEGNILKNNAFQADFAAKQESEPIHYTDLSDEQLKISLHRAVETEEYEMAAKIRDEIERRLIN